MKIKLPYVEPREWRITREWAKQLLLEVRVHAGEDVDGIDFAKMNVLALDRKNAAVGFVNVPITNLIDVASIVAPRVKPKFETIKMQNYGDPINNEVTRMGYGPKSNTLIVGFTRQWKIKTTTPGDGK